MARYYACLSLILALTACDPASEGDSDAPDDETGMSDDSESASSGATDTEAGDGDADTGDGDTGDEDTNDADTGDGDTTSTTGEDVSPETLAIGDSILEWNEEDGQSIPQVWAQLAGLSMQNSAISGSMVMSGGEESIPNQYQSGNWGRVLIDGGANDVGPDGCGCGDCMDVVDQLVSADASTGAMVDLVAQITGDGSRVVLMGYYTVGPGTEFSGCEDEMDALNARYEAIAAGDPMVDFVGAADVVDGNTQPEYFDEDGIHPSPEGSQVLGAYIAQKINGVGG